MPNTHNHRQFSTVVCNLKNIIMQKIKTTFYCLLFITFFVSCKNSSSKEKKSVELSSSKKMNIEEIAIDYLYDKIKTKDNITLKNNEIHFGDTSIILSINIEYDGKKDGKWILSASFNTKYKANEESQLITSSIGIGSTKEEAYNVCIQEWFAVFGIPFTEMLNSNEFISIDNMKIHSGLMGIRGTLPENTWLKGDKEMTIKIINVIKEQIKKSTNKIVSVDIKIVIGKNGLENGECRINNQISNELLNNLEPLDWTNSNQNYMFKQFYLIEK